ncbi:hypothetical protein B0H14DRAFT_2570655 [Mycena olivaceomarginata]|nr:hypothetical protein B0H14DRAFT_2570655 [Mycena olivaceomarginata]
MLSEYKTQPFSQTNRSHKQTILSSKTEPLDTRGSFTCVCHDLRAPRGTGARQRVSYHESHCFVKNGIGRRSYDLASQKFAHGRKNCHASHEDEQSLSRAEEDEIVDWLVELDAWGLHIRRRLVVQRTEASLKYKAAQSGAKISTHLGINWFNHFLNRHPNMRPALSQRKDIARRNAERDLLRFAQLYSNLGRAYAPPYNIRPENMYNCDEKGFMIAWISASPTGWIDNESSVAWVEKLFDRETYEKFVDIFNLPIFYITNLFLRAERENELLENKASLEREGTLQAQVKSLRDAIQLDKRRTDLKEELNEVCTEIEQEKSGRREWALRRTELDRQINELCSGPLAGTRINGRRPTERLTGEIEPLAPSTQDVTRNTMDEGVMDDWMEAEEPEYQLEYAGPRYEGTTKFITDPVPTAEYEEPVNELEYAGPIYEPDSFGVPMEYPPKLDAGPSAAGLDNFNMEDIFPNFDPQAFDFGSTYDLPPLPCTPSILPSHTSGHGRDAINPEAQNEGAGGRCTKYHSRKPRLCEVQGSSQSGGSRVAG